MSTDELEQRATRPSTVGDEPDAGERDSEAKTRHERRDHGCRPVQETYQGLDPPMPRSNGSTRNRWRPSQGCGRAGFPAGPGARQLVVKRFRKEVSDQVKSKLLMASLEQLDQDYKLEPITQPQLDVAAIELPEDGPMNFEMDVEVRPQFELPNYKGLSLKRPVKPITETDIETHLQLLPRALRPDRAQARGGRRDWAITSRPTWCSSARMAAC